jgi:two-component system chemotaxis response regulator CheY
MSWDILIVDDAAFIREALIQICQSSGHLVVGEAANGNEAVEKALELRPQVIIMDLVMPEKNGVEAIREILELLPHTLIVACSSVDQEFLYTKAQQAGAVKFLAKPFKKQQVVDTLKALSSVGSQVGGSRV